MKEEERLEIIKRVNNAMEEFKKIEKYKTELNSLMQDEKVKRYLFLHEQIANYAYNENLFKGELEKMIYYEFVWGFKSRLHGQSFDSCNHDIWIYKGSYGYWEDPRNEHDCKYLCDDENSKDFYCNKYECLECGQEVETNDWKSFENNHFVLKDINQRNVEYYRNMYYQFLYNNPVDVAQQMVIDEFNKNKSKSKRSRKKTK